jgi:hypothetical protein
VARLPYAESVEYFFVETPVVGTAVRIGEGRIIGSDIGTQKRISSPLAPGVVGGIAGLVAFLAAVAIGAETPSTSSKPAHTGHNRLYIGVALGAATAAVTYLFVKHRRATANKSRKRAQDQGCGLECRQ